MYQVGFDLYMLYPEAKNFVAHADELADGPRWFMDTFQNMLYSLLLRLK